MKKIPDLTAEQVARAIQTYRFDIAKMTQDQFAEATGIPVGTLRNWEQAHRNDASATTARLFVLSLDLQRQLAEARAELESLKRQYDFQGTSPFLEPIPPMPTN